MSFFLLGWWKLTSTFLINSLNSQVLSLEISSFSSGFDGCFSDHDEMRLWGKMKMCLMCILSSLSTHTQRIQSWWSSRRQKKSRQWYHPYHHNKKTIPRVTTTIWEKIDSHNLLCSVPIKCTRQDKTQLNKVHFSIFSCKPRDDIKVKGLKEEIGNDVCTVVSCPFFG